MTSDHVPCKRSCAGGAPPHTDTLIRPAACGRVQIGLFKTTRQCAKLSLPLLATRPPTPRKDDPDGPLDSRLKTG